MRGTVLTRVVALAAAALLMSAAPPSSVRAATTWNLNSWETGTEGWNGSGGMTVSQTSVGATAGAYSMNVAAPGAGFQWGANTEYNVANLDPNIQNAVQGFNFAGNGRETQSWFEFDVTWIGAENAPDWAGVQMAINSANGWTQSPDNLAMRTFPYDLATDTIHVVTPAIGSWSGIGTNKLPNGDGQWFQIHLGINPTGAGPDNVHIDGLKLVTPDVPEPTGLALAGVGLIGALRRSRRPRA
jgi:MYXO-CTERM domain-containing protein